MKCEQEAEADVCMYDSDVSLFCSVFFFFLKSGALVSELDTRRSVWSEAAPPFGCSAVKRQR